MQNESPGIRMISKHEAAVVLHHYGHDGGYAGSDFSGALVELMARADWENLGRLGLGFPGYATAVRLANRQESGIALLQAVVKGDPFPAGFWCPRCLRPSASPADMLDGYCGNCHARTALPVETETHEWADNHMVQAINRDASNPHSRP